MDRLLTKLEQNFDFGNLAELTIEAGRPDTIDEEKLRVLRAHNTTRVSINPQTMEDNVLAAIGRRHTADDIRRAMDQVRAAGFPHVNMDLIAGLPEDTPEGFRRSLDEVLSMGADNITVHAGASITGIWELGGSGKESSVDTITLLSGGEKVRCMFSRMMLFQSNVLILDRPTNHLDLESITAVNNGLSEFKGNLLFASHDHEILETAANRIIEITENGCLDRQGTYDDFVAWRHENVGGKLML